MASIKPTRTRRFLQLLLKSTATSVPCPECGQPLHHFDLDHGEETWVCIDCENYELTAKLVVEPAAGAA